MLLHLLHLLMRIVPNWLWFTVTTRWVVVPDAVGVAVHDVAVVFYADDSVVVVVIVVAEASVVVVIVVAEASVVVVVVAVVASKLFVVETYLS